MFDHYDSMTMAEVPLVTPKTALTYIHEKNDPQLDLMIQFECMCANCLFSDYMPMPFSLRN